MLSAHDIELQQQLSNNECELTEMIGLLLERTQLIVTLITWSIYSEVWDLIFRSSASYLVSCLLSNNITYNRGCISV